MFKFIDDLNDLAFHLEVVHHQHHVQVPLNKKKLNFNFIDDLNKLTIALEVVNHQHHVQVALVSVSQGDENSLANLQTSGRKELPPCLRAEDV